VQADVVDAHDDAARCVCERHERHQRRGRRFRRERRDLRAGTMNGRRRVAAFVLVGCVAAAVHWSVVVALVEGFAWPPLLANVGGWLIAFGASFGGHALLTFADQGAPAWRARARSFRARGASRVGMQ
jgi:putative flippase GtrA